MMLRIVIILCHVSHVSMDMCRRMDHVYRKENACTHKGLFVFACHGGLVRTRMCFVSFRFVLFLFWLRFVFVLFVPGLGWPRMRGGGSPPPLSPLGPYNLRLPLCLPNHMTREDGIGFRV